MPAVNPGEIWMTDFGMAAKVRPALILTGAPAADELDLVTVALRSRRFNLVTAAITRCGARKQNNRISMWLSSAGVQPFCQPRWRLLDTNPVEALLGRGRRIGQGFISAVSKHAEESFPSGGGKNVGVFKGVVQARRCRE